MKLIYTMPFMLRNIRSDLIYDVNMAKRCLSSLQGDKDTHLIIYNQGIVTNKNVEDFLREFDISFEIMGQGVNVGIPKARQEMFKYIWNKYEDIPYICEVHLDMIFYYKWYEVLINFLEVSDEPMVSPGIINKLGEFQPPIKNKSNIILPDEHLEISKILEGLSEDKLEERFVHPVIHKSEVLRSIGGYDDRFLIGKQGFEDDSLLLGYLYYMGLRSGWKPKCLLKSIVYHETLAQRMSLNDLNEEVRKNREGLFNQYGAYGFKELAKLHNNKKFNDYFDEITEKISRKYIK